MKKRMGDEVVCVVMSCLLLAAMGCGSSDPGIEVGEVMPVKGKVTIDDKPAPGVSLSFVADPSNTGAARISCAGVTDSSGNYEIFSSGSRQSKSGAPLGKYKVTITAAPLDEPTEVEIPEKYSRVETSGLEVEVVESPGEGAYDLKLSKQ